MIFPLHEIIFFSRHAAGRMRKSAGQGAFAQERAAPPCQVRPPTVRFNGCRPPGIHRITCEIRRGEKPAPKVCGSQPAERLPERQRVAGLRRRRLRPARKVRPQTTAPLYSLCITIFLPEYFFVPPTFAGDLLAVILRSQRRRRICCAAKKDSSLTLRMTEEAESE